MPLTPRPTEVINGSAAYNFLYGRFALGRYSIPYLVISMRLSDAARELEIAEEAGMTYEEAELEELYQRQVDWDRVLHRIAPYLRNAERPQFFNALTIAMLPKDEHGSFVSFESDSLEAPRLDGEFTNVFPVGPVKVGVYGDGGPENPGAIQVGQVRWNRDQVYCLAIDGQHRLGAIKQLHEEGRSELRDSHITVILVLPSIELGLSGEANRRGHVRLMRDLFTDLNKHAVSVSRTRELLLDDHDPQSLCVRRAVGKALVEVPKDWKASDPTRVPLAFVDWHTDESKFADGPYLSSLLVLDQVIGELVGIKPLRDWSDLGEVRSRQIGPLERLGWRPTPECKRRLGALESGEGSLAFTYPEEDLNAIVDAFASTWSPAITHLLTEPDPYAELIAIRRRERMLSPEFVMWYDAFQADARNRNVKTLTKLQRIKDQLRDRTPPINPEREWEPWFKKHEKDRRPRMSEFKEETLFFKVVFQKALFSALHVLSASGREWDQDANEAPPLIEEGLTEDGLTIYLWAVDLVDAVNALLQHPSDTSFFDIRHRGEAPPHDLFWLGTVAKADAPDTIDFTNAAAKRARHWLVLATLLWRFRHELMDAEIPDSPTDTPLPQLLEDLTEELPTGPRNAFLAAAEHLYGDRQGRAMRYVVQAAHPDVESPSNKFTSLLHAAFFRRFSHLHHCIEHVGDES